jgi:group I intron endonuclease
MNLQNKIEFPKKGLLYREYLYSGIYGILNKLNNKIYIGSSKSLGSRLNEHKYDLIKNIHNNKKLQRAFLKYGLDNFIFLLLEKCDESDLLSREQYYLDLYKCYDSNFGYNLCPTANRTVISEETRNWFKINNKGEKNKFYGKKHTTERKKIWSELRKNKNLGEYNYNYGNRGEKNPLYGKKHTTEMNEKKSKALSKPITAIKDGIKSNFDSLKSFSEYVGCSRHTVSSAIRRNNKCKGYILIKN